MQQRILFSWAAFLLAMCVGGTAFGQTTIVSDNYDVTTSTTGFALDNGVNFGINPPTTRLGGTAAANLRYIQTVTGRSTNLYGISSKKLRVQQENTIGRFTLSANGATPFNFASALGTAGASATNPAVYEIRIGMQNNATGTARLSFGLGTAEGDVNSFDFGIQMYRAVSGNDFYTIGKLIDTGSSGVADIKAVMTTLPAGTGGSLTNFLIRVTDAGAESDTNYHSRVQVSIDNGTTWIYDTSTDSALPNGWRLDGGGRVIVWDQAANTSGNVFYDNFSVVSIYAPPPPPERVWTGAGMDDNWSTGANWGGTAPVSGEPLLFGLSARQANSNDLSLTTPTLTFSNGGFVLSGNLLEIESAVFNLAGNNTIALPLEWPSTGPKNWQIAAGTELKLSGASTLTTLGDHALYGGGTLRLTGSLDINANPAFIISEGKFVLDGGTNNSQGGFRIGSGTAASAPVEVVVSNSASLTLELPAANLRVGDGAADVASRLIVNNGTVTMSGGNLGIPYVAGCTGEVLQTGGLVKDCYVAFSDNGAGVGTYVVDGGTLEPFQIRRDTAGGTATMRFNNAILRPANGANSDFLRGLDVAEIQAGGLTIDATTDISIAQPLTGAGGLTKVNTMATFLTGQNAYAGNTLVQAGKLVLPNIQTNAASIVVANAAELGVAQTAPNASLTAGSLSLGTSTLSFDLGTFGSPNVPLAKVTTLAATGGAGSVTVNISGGLGLTLGPFTLVDYSGAIGGSGFGAFTLAGLPPGVSATLVNNVANSSIDLNMTATPGFRWTGAHGSSWDSTTTNWFDYRVGASSAYTDGDPTWFLDGAATGIVDLTAGYAPSLLTVSNSSLSYVFGGVGSLAVPWLIKSGPGSLTRVDGGADLISQIELNAGSYISSNTFDTGFWAVLADTSAGLGTFVKSGAGGLTVYSTNSTYDGAIVIQQGMLKVGATEALGSSNGTVTVLPGASLDVNDIQSPHKPVVVSGAGVGGQGAITESSGVAGVQHNLTDVILVGDTTFGSATGGRWDIRVRTGSGVGPGLRGNGYNLTKVGAGSVSIACQRHFGADTPYWQMNLGDVVIAEGGLTFAESLSLGNPTKTITIAAGANMNTYDLNVTNPIVRTIIMTDAQISSGGGTRDTNVFNGPIQLTGNGHFRVNNSTRMIINGPIVGTGSVNYSDEGAGMLLLNGTNTCTGVTTVTNGTLGGNGIIAGSLVMLGGTNSPGVGIGTLTVNGAATLDGTTLIELNRSLSPNSDRLVVGGTLTFGGVLQVVLGADAPTPQAGDVYQLFNKGSSSAFTGGISLPSLTGGLTWDTSKLTVNGTLSVAGAVTPPTIGTVSLSGGNFILSGTGGTEGDTYYVVTSPDVAAPLAGWAQVASNVFGPGGSFSFTTNVVGGAPKAFFRLLVP